MTQQPRDMWFSTKNGFAQNSLPDGLGYEDRRSF